MWIVVLACVFLLTTFFSWIVFVNLLHLVQCVTSYGQTPLRTLAMRDRPQKCTLTTVYVAVHTTIGRHLSIYGWCALNRMMCNICTNFWFRGCSVPWNFNPWKIFNLTSGGPEVFLKIMKSWKAGIHEIYIAHVQ